jgi:hypothetical protein
MGTTTHKEDFNMILSALDKINKEYNNPIELSITGVTNFLPDEVWLKALTPSGHTRLYPNFVKWFLRQGPFDIGLAPLVNSEFNRAKSDIKVLDYLCMGVLPIVSDIEPYKASELDDFVVRVGYGPNDWYQAFKDLLENHDHYAKQKMANQHKLGEFINQERSVRIVSQDMLREIKEQALKKRRQ